LRDLSTRCASSALDPRDSHCAGVYQFRSMSSYSESGDVTDLPQAQALNSGDVLGSPYSGLQATRIVAWGARRGCGTPSSRRRWVPSMPPGSVGLYGSPSRAPWLADRLRGPRAILRSRQEACELGPSSTTPNMAGGRRPAVRSALDVPDEPRLSVRCRIALARDHLGHWLPPTTFESCKTTACHFLPVDGKPARQLAVKDTVTGAGSVVSATAFVLAGAPSRMHAFSFVRDQRPGWRRAVLVDVSWNILGMARSDWSRPTRKSLTVRRSTTCGVQRMARSLATPGTTRRHRLDGCPAQLFGDVAAATAGVRGRTTLARTHRHRQDASRLRMVARAETFA